MENNKTLVRTLGVKTINLGDKVNVKIKTLDRDNPKVIQIMFSLWSKAQYDDDKQGYEDVKKNIYYRYKRMCRQYIKDNNTVFSDKFIDVFDFTTTNLKRGFKKYITATLYLKQLKSLSFDELSNLIEHTLQNGVNDLTESFNENNFSVSSDKQNL